MTRDLGGLPYELIAERYSRVTDVGTNPHVSFTVQRRSVDNPECCESAWYGSNDGNSDFDAMDKWGTNRMAGRLIGKNRMETTEGRSYLSPLCYAAHSPFHPLGHTEQERYHIELNGTIPVIRRDAKEGYTTRSVETGPIIETDTASGDIRMYMNNMFMDHSMAMSGEDGQRVGRTDGKNSDIRDMYDQRRVMIELWRLHERLQDRETGV